MTGQPVVDARVMRVTAAANAALLLAAFPLDAVHEAWAALVPLVAALHLANAASRGRANLWGQLYQRAVKLALRIGPGRAEDARPPRFAQWLGGGTLLVATLGLYAPLTANARLVLGWGAALLVAGLALLNAATGICVGCRLYVLGRRALGRRAPPARA